jgi:hypothetical protein
MGKKRILLQITISGVVILFFGQFGIEKVGASAMIDNDGCDLMEPDHGFVKYGDYEDARGVTVAVDTIEPKNVVVVGQDEKRKGVSFYIKVESQPGTIKYMTPAWHCGGTDESESYEDTGNSCGSYIASKGIKYQYLRKVCEPIKEPQTVYRSIENILVTLEPDIDTMDLFYGDTKAIPFIYPAYWKDINLQIVFTDTYGIGININELPYLEALGSINLKSFEGMPILIPNYRNDRFAMLVYNDYLVSSCATPTEDCGDKKTRGQKPGQKPELTYTYEISPKNLPIELPGNWYIVVWVVLGPAYFGPVLQQPESLDPIDTNDNLIRMPTDKEAEAFPFESYAIISTPCNPEEQYGCTDSSS